MGKTGKNAEKSQVWISSKLHERLKRYAKKEGRLMGFIAEAAIAAYLEVKTGEELPEFDHIEQT